MLKQLTVSGNTVCVCLISKSESYALSQVASTSQIYFLLYSGDSGPGTHRPASNKTLQVMLQCKETHQLLMLKRQGIPFTDSLSSSRLRAQLRTDALNNFYN